ncbi:hypothetical protein Raf01_07800 [Rugosimonospora africana]|uniref:Uncharacterized protein n=1 Tax=Rugosimonospora africana TaxID=556532 RepID=A0A8J3QN47_9ACTN|nr:hypothetical protein Raf01_07800 [Rugosimonospora africana]
MYLAGLHHEVDLVVRDQTAEALGDATQFEFQLRSPLSKGAGTPRRLPDHYRGGGAGPASAEPPGPPDLWAGRSSGPAPEGQEAEGDGTAEPEELGTADADGATEAVPEPTAGGIG